MAFLPPCHRLRHFLRHVQVQRPRQRGLLPLFHVLRLFGHRFEPHPFRLEVHVLKPANKGKEKDENSFRVLIFFLILLLYLRCQSSRYLAAYRHIVGIGSTNSFRPDGRPTSTYGVSTRCENSSCPVYPYRSTAPKR